MKRREKMDCNGIFFANGVRLLFEECADTYAKDKQKAGLKPYRRQGCNGYELHALYTRASHDDKVYPKAEDCGVVFKACAAALL
ncbi:MAG: hypothetical protein ACLT0Y_00500 [Christensenellales bacterium]